MLVEQRPSYLLLNNQPSGPSLQIVGSLARAIEDWDAGSRVSPIWPIRHYAKAETGRDKFNGSHELVFLGPVQPSRLPAALVGLAAPGLFEVWVSAGCFNVILRCRNSGAVEEVLTWSKYQHIPYEHWTILDGKIINTEHYTLAHSELKPALKELSKLADATIDPALRATLEENLTLSATALARSAAIYPAAFSDFKITTSITAGLLKAHADGDLGILDLQSRILTLNAALSRFSSQAFSGIPPIAGTECHLWIHSLLGTGSANIALANVVGWIQRAMGDAQLPERLAALANDSTNVPTLRSLSKDAEFLDRDPLDGPEPGPRPGDISAPLITYFSGRDGFSSHLQTLSAPLTTISECNSYRSSLLTVTHEISHIFVQLFLADLYPRMNEEADYQHARLLISPKYEATTWLDSARQLMLEAIIGIEQADGDELSIDELNDALPDLLQRRRREAQEIIVHTFDFAYFYAGDPSFYIKSIWHSWCAIPGIRDRVPEYLMRTICAVSVLLLKEPPQRRMQAAVVNTKKILSDLANESDLLSTYVDDALALLNRLESDATFRKQAERRYGARIQLVRLVAVFLLSDTLKAKLFDDPHIGRGRGYERKQLLTYDQEPVGNPLTFLRAYLKDDPSEAESLWVLHALAFDIPSSPPPGG